jgi:sugar lactone lactonase YvrE
MKKHLCLTVLIGALSSSFAADATFRSLSVGASPESVVPGFGGRLFVTLMGTQRQKGDGDGKIVVVDGEKVSVLTEGLDDPKGIVFVGGKLITADFDKVWAVDADGNKTLLAGPDAFPERPMFLNDIVVEPGEQTMLVTDMGDLAAMTDAKGAFWPLDSEQAKTVTPHGRIYRMTLDGKISVAVDHAPEMPNPNGVDALRDGTILAGEFFRGTLLAWQNGKSRVLSDDHRSLDGIVHDDAGNFYITEVRTGRVWQVKAATGEKHALAQLESAADLHLDRENQQLVVPDSKAGKLVFIPIGKN